MDNSVTNPSFEMAGPEPKARKNILTQIFPWVVLFFLAALVITPIFSLVAGSFSLSRLPNEFSLDNLGFDNFYAVWIEQRIDRVIWNTTIYVIGATVFGVTTAGVLAWLVERSDMPGKTWIYAGVPLGIAVPGILHAIAWVLLLSPRSGFVNRAWMDVTPDAGAADAQHGSRDGRGRRRQWGQPQPSRAPHYAGAVASGRPCDQHLSGHHGDGEL